MCCFSSSESDDKTVRIAGIVYTASVALVKTKAVFFVK